jgi:hypothetical protein
VVDVVFSMHEVLGSIPSTISPPKKRKKKKKPIVNQLIKFFHQTKEINKLILEMEMEKDKRWDNFV